MKTHTIKLSLIPALMAALIMLPAQRAAAQTFTNLYNFSEAAYDDSLGNGTNSDGYSPFSGVIVSGNVLYGTAFEGGTNGNGTLFSLNTSDGGFATLHTFAAGQENGLYLNGIHISTNQDGSEPVGSLVLAGGILYGTAEDGGTNGFGTIFSLTTNGTAFKILHAFNSANGRNIQGGLIASSLNILYGTAFEGGTNDSGLVFAINTNGTGFTDLYSFSTSVYDPENSANTNRDGLNPNGVLTLLGNTLFGTAQNGGTNGVGTIFAVNTNGAGFTNLYNFSGSTDGSEPNGALVFSSSGSALYGTSIGGGAYDEGTVFSININGTGFVTLYSMDYNNIYPDGIEPRCGVVLSGNSLYGADLYGGANYNGSIFALTLSATAPAAVPELTIQQAGTNIVVTWPTNFTGYILEFATNLPPLLWYTNLPAPVVVGTNYAVTNGMFYTQQYYQLSP